MKKFDAIIFDFDGTLFDTRKNIMLAVNKTRKQYNKEVHSIEKVISWIGHGAPYLAKNAFADLIDENFLFDEIFKKYLENYHQDSTKEVEIYDSVLETIPKLDLPLYIISNKPEENIHPLLKKFSLQDSFQFIIGGDTLPWKKPSPEIMNYIEEKTKLHRENMLMVGDFSADVLFAKACNMKSVYCNYGFTGNDTDGANWHIDKFSELMSIIK